MTYRHYRILFLSSDKFPPFRVDVSVLFGKELQKLNAYIDFILQSDEDCSENYITKWSGCTAYIGATDNGKTRRMQLRKNWLGFANDLKLIKLTRSEQYDFLQVKDKFLIAIIAIVVSKIRKMKFIFWLSYPFPEAAIFAARKNIARYRYFSFIKGIVFKLLTYKFIVPLADHVFVQSAQMKRALVAEGAFPEKLTAVPMGVDFDQIPYGSTSFITKNRRQKADEKWVVYLGTLNRIRQLDFLVRSFFLVQKVLPEARLYLVGDSDDYDGAEHLAQEARDLGIKDKIIFTGFLSMEEGWAYVKDADICVSLYPPNKIFDMASPTKLVEYMALGKAVVANDHPEQTLLIHESGGGLCTPYEEKEFANAMKELLVDPATTQLMGELGREYVEKHRSYKILAGLVNDKYLELQNDEPRKRP